MSIRQYVTDLHPGQVATLLLAAFIMVGLLFYARSRVAETARTVANAETRLRDSELSQLSQRRTSIDVQIGSRDLLDASFKGSHEYDSLKREKVWLDSLWMNRLGQPTSTCSRCARQLAIVDAGLAVTVGFSLSVLWMWFGGRRLTRA